MSVLKFEDVLKSSNENKIENNSNKTDKKVKPKVQKLEIPKGKPKSGRIWKNQKTRFKANIKSKGLKKPYEKKEKLREELKRAKEASRAVLERRKQEKEAKRLRTEENKKRQEENRKRSEIVQVIKNTAKLKKMKKKHLRFIEKRDTTNM